MPYEIEINRAGSSRLRQQTSLMTSGRTHGVEGAAAHYKFYELEPALVISVDITNKDSREIGKAILRPLYSYATVPESKLPTAVPLDSNVKSYPLKGEIVIVVEYSGRLYYTQRLNFLNFPNQNITKDPYKLLSQDQQNASDRTATSAGNPNVSGNENEDKPGKYFTPDKTIQSLLPLEGDIIYEGRFGQSLRFGGTVEEGTSGVDEGKEKLKRFKGTWAIGDRVGAPIVILRNGQKLGGDATKSYVEDINKDPSSIYITNGQIIPLKVANTNQKAWAGSAPSVYDGNQIILASDRLIFNSKKGEIMLFATAPIGISTPKSFYVDVGVDVVINSPKIYLGLNAKESVVLGDKTAEWLKALIGEMRNLINAINQTVVRTGTGPSDPVQSWAPNATGYNKVNSALTQLENKINTLLSKQNFTL